MRWFGDSSVPLSVHGFCGSVPLVAQLGVDPIAPVRFVESLCSLRLHLFCLFQSHQSHLSPKESWSRFFSSGRIGSADQKPAAARKKSRIRAPLFPLLNARLIRKWHHIDFKILEASFLRLPVSAPSVPLCLSHPFSISICAGWSAFSKRQTREIDLPSRLIQGKQFGNHAGYPCFPMQFASCWIFAGVLLGFDPETEIF